MGRACANISGIRKSGTVHGLVYNIQAYFCLALFSPFNTNAYLDMSLIRPDTDALCSIIIEGERKKSPSAKFAH